MKRSLFSAIALATAGAALPAAAGVSFENVNIGGSLSAGASFEVLADDIDFVFPQAQVGDNAGQSGTITITYEAQGTDGTVFNQMLAGIAGDLAGSGQIYFNEIIEDLNGGGVLGSYNALIDLENGLPFGATIPFNQESDHVKIKKTLILTGLDTEEFDLAGIDLVSQRLIPTPGVGALLGLGALSLVRRRRA